MELRPDRNLLDRNFEGYTLSLEKIPTREVRLEGGVHRVVPSPEHYTQKHARLFGTHDHLVVDERSDDVYYVDAARNVVKVWDGAKLWKVPPQRPGGYNMSLKLPSESYAVLADGSGKLYILERTQDSWTSAFEEDLATPFVLLDCVYESESRTMKCLRFQVTHEGDKHYSDLYYTVVRSTDGKFALGMNKRLRSKGELYYAALEHGADYVCIASDSSFAEDDTKIESSKYTWSQDEEWVVLRMQVRRHDVRVSVEAKELLVRVGGETMLSGKLHAKVRPTLSTWQVEGNVLELLLKKDNNGVRWTEVVAGNDEGECIYDEEFVEQVHRRLAHLCSEEKVISANSSILNTSAMEECDFPTTSDGLIERISVDTCRATETAHLGFRGVLFAKKLAVDRPPSLAVHHDEDVCMFQPSTTDDGWRLEHVGTLHAFGYVQASKQRRKYLTCAPDFGYSIVCESDRHLFVYRRAKSLSGGNELKHRFTGRTVRSVAQQQVVELKADEVLGVHADNARLLVMTAKCLYVFSM